MDYIILFFLTLVSAILFKICKLHISFKRLYLLQLEAIQTLKNKEINDQLKQKKLFQNSFNIFKETFFLTFKILLIIIPFGALYLYDIIFSSQLITSLFSFKGIMFSTFIFILSLYIIKRNV